MHKIGVTIMKEKLKLGVATEIITPKIGCNLCGYTLDVISSEVNDDLTATAYYFSDGKTEALMLSITVCVIDAKLAHRISAEIEELTGIPRDNIIVHATHTHSGPVTADIVGFGTTNVEYVEGTFLPRIKKAASDAKATAEAVTMGVSVGESKIGVNRRELTEENEIILGQNPWAPYDPKMTVVSFKNEAGDVKASMIHYGCHCTGAGRNTEITRDFAGVMIDWMEKYGGGVCAFFCGPEGDVGPRLISGRTAGGGEREVGLLGEDGKTVFGNIKIAMQHGAWAANDAIRIFKDTRGYHDASLDVSKRYIKLPVEKRPSLEFAKEEYEKYKQYTVNYLGAKAAHLRDVIMSYEEGYEEKEFIEIEQIVIKVGDVAFVGTPFELFAEIGLRIQKHSPSPYTLLLSNVGGTEGYFPTESDICRGGYEVTMFKQKYIQPCVDNADYHFVKETLDHLRSI